MKAITAEAIDLLRTSPVGDWDVSAELSQLEYQLGQRLIYVQYPMGRRLASMLRRPNAWCVMRGPTSTVQSALRRRSQGPCFQTSGRPTIAAVNLERDWMHMPSTSTTLTHAPYIAYRGIASFSTPTPDTMSSTYGRTRQSKNVCQSRRRPSSSSTCGASGQGFSRTWHHRSIRLTPQAHIQFGALLAARMSCAFFAGIDACRDLLTGLAGPFARRGRWESCPG